MTDLSADQNAMLERVARKYCYPHQCELGNGIVCHESDLIAALRELLLAVQETNAEAVRMNECGKDEDGHSCHEDDARVIRAQTYGDLFPEEE